MKSAISQLICIQDKAMAYVTLIVIKSTAMKKLLHILFCAAAFSFTTNAQMLNGGMENYDFLPADTVPSGWNMDSYWSTKTGQSSDAHGGNYSFVINTWYGYSPGMMVNGDASNFTLLFDWVKAGTPITYKPAQLQGWYKYIDTVANDSAIVKVLLKKWNSSQNKIDSVAYAEKKLPFANTWTQFNVDINELMPGVNPDSLVVYFMTFDYLAGTQFPCQNMECRYLYIDDLSLNGLLSVNENLSLPEDLSFVYTEDRIILTKKDYNTSVAQVFSLDGKMMVSSQIKNGRTEISTHEFSAGIYFVTCNGKSFKLVKT
ncbi:MAG: T9SS type A sorting domain-containing protein [Bacteroidia bacterium]|nr:T9SS type A sorting domain-containing protein [Bacteroidia bacterium]